MEHLAVLAKYWTPGRVKTRLAAAVGPRSASTLARAFLQTTLQRLSHCANRRCLAYEPRERESIFRALAGPAWTLVPQVSGHLGERMRACLADAFDSGARRVVLLGADSPTLPLERVTQAFELLNNYPVVIGPSDDGGYYLLGAAERVPPIFADIAWGTDTVWRQTSQRLHDCGIPFATTTAWYDVDDYHDLQRLWGELRPGVPLPGCLESLRATVASVMTPLAAAPDDVEPH